MLISRLILLTAVIFTREHSSSVTCSQRLKMSVFPNMCAKAHIGALLKGWGAFYFFFYSIKSAQNRRFSKKISKCALFNSKVLGTLVLCQSQCILQRIHLKTYLQSKVSLLKEESSFNFQFIKS